MKSALAQKFAESVVSWWFFELSVGATACFFLVRAAILLSNSIGRLRAACVGAALLVVWFPGSAPKYLALCLGLYVTAWAAQRSIKKLADEPWPTQTVSFAEPDGKYISMRLNDDDAKLVVKPVKPRSPYPTKIAGAVCGGLVETSLVLVWGLVPLVFASLALMHAASSAAGTLRSVEYGIVRTQLALRHYTGFPEIASLMTAAAIVAIFKPRWKPVTQVALAARWTNRIALALTLMASYSFFTAVESQAEVRQGWALVHREELFKELADLDSWTRLTAAAARLETRIPLFSPADKQNFSQVIRNLPDADRAREYGTTIGEDTMPVSSRPDESPSGSGPIAESIARIRHWLRAPDSMPAPDEHDERVCEKETSLMREAYTQRRQALIEVVLALLDVPELPIRDTVEPFVRSVISSTAESAMDQVFPEDVADLSTAPNGWHLYSRLVWKRGTGALSASSEDVREPGNARGTATEEQFLVRGREEAAQAWKEGPEAVHRSSFMDYFKSAPFHEPMPFEEEIRERGTRPNERRMPIERPTRPLIEP